MYEMEGALLDPADLGWPVRLAAPAPAGRPPGPATRVRFRFPGSFRVPRDSPREVSVSDVEVFLLLESRVAQASGGSN